MQRNILTYLPEDILKFIVTHLNDLNDHDIRSGVMLACKYFNKIIHESNLLKRPKWYGVNYQEKNPSSQKIHLPSSINGDYPNCKAFPLRNGDIAFGLSNLYDQQFNIYTRGPKRLSKDWKDNLQAILVFCSGKENPIELVGHQHGIRHVIQHNASTLASIGVDNTIRIWDKLTGTPKRIINNYSENSYYFSSLNLRNIFPGSPKGYIDNPVHILSLNNDELACFNHSGKAFVWNITTGGCKRELLNFSSQRLDGFIQKNGYLIIRHENSENEHYSSWALKKHTIFDIKNEKTIKTLVTAELLPELLKYMKLLYESYPYLSQQHYKEVYVTDIEDTECKDYCHDIAIITRHRTTYFYDTKHEKIIFGFPGQNVQYKFLEKEKGTLVILYHTPEGWHILSDYCHETNEFKVKYSQSEDRINQDQYEYFTDRTWLILDNGNIVTFHWKNGFSSQWCLSTKDYLPEFKLEMPSITFNMEENCRYNNALKCLPDGNILACSDDGEIIIWDGETSKHLHYQKIAEDYVKNDYFKCFNISQNGDLYFTWRVDGTDYESTIPNTYDSKLLRFNMFQNNTSIKNNESKNTEAEAIGIEKEQVRMLG